MEYVNGAGAASQRLLPLLPPHLLLRPFPQIDAAISSADQNDDGQIDFEEFVAMLRIAAPAKELVSVWISAIKTTASKTSRQNPNRLKPPAISVA